MAKRNTWLNLGKITLMSEWQVIAEFYLEASNEGEAWSMATLDLPKDAQIIKLKEKESA